MVGKLKYLVLAAILMCQNSYAKINNITSDQIKDNSITSADIADNSITADNIADNSLSYDTLSALNTPTDELCLTYEGTGDAFEWASCGAGGGITESYGTCTVTFSLSGGSGNTVPQFSVNECVRSKQGHSVTYVVNVAGDGGNEGAGTGRLDFSVSDTPSTLIQDQCALSPLSQNGSSFFMVQACIASGSSVIRLYKMNGIYDPQNLTGGDLSSTTRGLQFVFTFLTDS